MATFAAVLGGVSYVPALVWIVEIWTGGVLGGAAAGLLTIPICMVLLWVATRRRAWTEPGPDRGGAVWVLGATAVVNLGALFWAGEVWDALLVSALTLPPAVWAWTWGRLGWQRAAALSTPIFFGWFAIPWEYFLRGVLDAKLQILTTDMAFAGLRWVGYPVRRYTDLTFYTREFYVTVNETCSGMNMLVTLAMYTILFGWLAQPGRLNRVWLLTFALPLSIFANTVRVMVIFLMGHHGGKVLAMGAWHTGSAYLLFLPVFGLIYWVNQALSRRWYRAARAGRPERAGPA